jgi:hypothetical protein
MTRQRGPGRWLVLVTGVLLGAAPALSLPNPSLPNLDFEIDVEPKDEIPDGWQVTVNHGAEFEYSRGQAASGRWCARTTHTERDQSSLLAHRAAGLIEPGRWYRIRYWFLAVGDSSRFGFRLASEDLQTTHDLDAILELPATDGKWHLYTTYPFRVTADELAAYPWLTFVHLEKHIGSIAVDDIEVEPSAPPD